MHMIPRCEQYGSGTSEEGGCTTSPRPDRNGDAEVGVGKGWKEWEGWPFVALLVGLPMGWPLASASMLGGCTAGSFQRSQGQGLLCPFFELLLGFQWIIKL